MRKGERTAFAIALPILSAALFYFFPLFRVVPLHQTATKTGSEKLDPVAFAERFWIERLLPSAESAVNATELISALKSDKQSASKKYGRRVGLGSVTYYFLVGEGRIVDMDKASISIAIRDSDTAVDILLLTGNLFGNAVRDGTGLIDINDIPDSQNFNAISSEINRRIEGNVLNRLKSQATLGAKVRFAGCAEIVDDEIETLPLRIIPFIADVQKP